ncbi:CCL4 protein, partial [Psilopogon haemacephalus]|nr:CCL4 protein [Psilopogon haemacephalus]
VGSDPSSCCFSYIAQQLPRNLLTSYYKTSSFCPQPAVIFVTKKGREVCANPEEGWVQRYMSDPKLQ